MNWAQANYIGSTVFAAALLIIMAISGHRIAMHYAMVAAAFGWAAAYIGAIAFSYEPNTRQRVYGYAAGLALTTVAIVCGLVALLVLLNR